MENWKEINVLYLGIQFQPKTYVGEDAAERLLDSLQKDLNTHIMPVIEKDVEMIWDEEAQQQFDAATECYICNKALDRDAETPARDHCHFTGNQFKFSYTNGTIVVIVCWK